MTSREKHLLAWTAAFAIAATVGWWCREHHPYLVELGRALAALYRRGWW